MDTPESWDPRFSVGHDLLDSQHRQLLSICAAVAAMVGTARVDSSERFHEALHELAQYARTHFDLEETLMRRCGYPELDRHIAEHSDCLKRLTDFLYAASHDVLAPEELHRFLSNWWTHHVCNSDARYAPYLRAAQ